MNRFGDGAILNKAQLRRELRYGGYMCRTIVLFVLGTMICGCIGFANHTESRTRFAFAAGHRSPKRSNVIDCVRIDVPNANLDDLKDTWVAMQDGKRIALSDITKDLLIKMNASVWKTNNPDGPGTVTYNLPHRTHADDPAFLSFVYDGERLEYMDVYPNAEYSGLRVGSNARQCGTKVPCTLHEFEAVFGKVTNKYGKWFW